MRNKYRNLILSIVCFMATAWAGTFGTVVPIGGQAIDLALDEARGVLYVANFTANRVEVISLSDNSLVRSMNVASQPSSVALSPDGKYLVIAHYGAFAAPLPSSNAITVIDLQSNARQTFVLGAPAFGVAFGAADQAFVATSTGFYLFDPRSGAMVQIASIADIQAKALPQLSNTFPLQITTASLATSRDGVKVFGLTENLRFVYNTLTGDLLIQNYVASPVQAPRVVSANQDGSKFLAGWALFEGNMNLEGRNSIISQFRNATGDLAIGSHAFDTFRNVIYAQYPTAAGSRTNPVLQIVDADNLAVLERLNLPESLAGKSLLNGDNSIMYSISDSGILVLPVGSLDSARRVRASQEDVVFRGNFCSKQLATQEVLIEDRSGANTDFTIVSSNTGVRVSPAAGTTPARVRLTVDPNTFLNQKGTTAVTLSITSQAAINQIDSVRVLVNNREPDQLGTFVNLPGKLIDILADPDRDRYYVLRQDKNQILVFDANTNSQFATLKTGNTPTQLAISFDRKYLMVGGDDTQMIWVYDLDTLQATPPVRMPGGHYPKSIASTGGTILVANRVAGATHKIDRVDLNNRTATEFPALGVFKNDINVNTVLVGAQNGSSIMAAMADGTVMLYSASADTFTVSRKDFGALSGAYAASNYDQFVIGNTLLNASLVHVGDLDADGAKSSGFSFVDRAAIRATAPDASSPGLIQRFDSVNGQPMTNRMIEAPVLSDVNLQLPFTRTIAPLPKRNAIIALTTSGLTVLPWSFDTPVGTPRVDRVVNAADYTESLAPGSLVTITGANLSSVTQAFTGSTTALGDSCILVNGQALPILYVSPSQINAELPTGTAGNLTLRIATPGGILDNFTINTTTTAPAIFRSTIPGMADPVATILRAENNLLVTPSNPVHRGDVLSIYATGLGATSPNFVAGTPASNSLVSVAIPPAVTLGGVPVQVLFAGLAPGQIGVYQINVKVYNNVPTGLSVPLQISQGGNSTSVAVRVVE